MHGELHYSSLNCRSIFADDGDSPGRFFAVSEMILMFAILLQRYDFKVEPGTAPKQLRIGTM